MALHGLLYSEDFIVSLTLAMVDKIPADHYGPQVAEEILRLEKIGESFMEF